MNLEIQDLNACIFLMGVMLQNMCYEAPMQISLCLLFSGSRLVLTHVLTSHAFNSKVRSQYQVWMVNSPFTYTPLGKKRAPSEELFSLWIHKA